jgi:anti-anti-sigma factor
VFYLQYVRTSFDNVCRARLFQGCPWHPDRSRYDLSRIEAMDSVPITAAQQLVQRTLPTLERRFDEVIAAKPPVIDLVLSAVQIVDSVGLNWLLSMQARLETLGIRIRLVDPSAIVADILLATRLDARFTIERTASHEHPHNGNGHSAPPGGSHAR